MDEIHYNNRITPQKHLKRLHLLSAIVAKGSTGGCCHSHVQDNQGGGTEEKVATPSLCKPAEQKVSECHHAKWHKASHLRWSCQNFILIAKAAEGELHSDVQQMDYATKQREM